MADLESTKVEGDIDISGIIINTDLEEKLKNVSSLKKYTMNITADTAKGAEITLPCEYTVGGDSLIIMLDNEVLIKATDKDSQGNYYEVGTAGTISNKIQLTSDWQLLAGDILTIYVGKPNVSGGDIDDRVASLEEGQLELTSRVNDIDSQQTDIVQRLVQLEQNDGGKTEKYTMNITADTAKGAEITLPCEYTVGSDDLIVVLNTEMLVKAPSGTTQGHYYEVGTNGEKSNKIQLTSDWNLSNGDILTLFVGNSNVGKKDPQDIVVNTIKNKNLFDKNDIIINAYLGYEDGTPTHDVNMCYMNSYIEVNSNMKYTMSYFGTEATILVVHEYDANKNFLRYTVQNNDNKSMTITTSAQTKYVRLSTGKTRANGIQFEEGAEQTEYSEHYMFKIHNQYITTGEEFDNFREIGGYHEYGRIYYINSLPSNSSITFNTGITNFDRYTYIEGYTSNSWGIKMVPQKIDDNSIVLHPEGSAMRITTYTDAYANAGYNAIVELHYTKTS